MDCHRVGTQYADRHHSLHLETQGNTKMWLFLALLQNDTKFCYPRPQENKNQNSQPCTKIMVLFPAFPILCSNYGRTECHQQLPRDVKNGKFVQLRKTHQCPYLIPKRVQILTSEITHHTINCFCISHVLFGKTCSKQGIS